jgi:hypothetical protein
VEVVNDVVEVKYNLLSKLLISISYVQKNIHTMNQ